MKYEVFLDRKYIDPEAKIFAREITSEVSEVIRFLEGAGEVRLIGFKGQEMHPISPADVFHIFAESGKVIAETNQNRYFLKKRLYELEELLAGEGFIRISNSEIVRAKDISHLSLDWNGTIRLTFKNQKFTYVSRRYVGKIKAYFGI